MATLTANRKPYLRQVTGNTPIQTPVGYNRIFDVRLEMGDIAMHDLIVEFSWHEEIAKSDVLALGAYKTVTKAAVEVMQAGLGWSKLLPVPGPDNTIIKFWQHFIQFERRLQMVVPIVPIGGELLKALEIQVVHLIVLKGVLDTATEKVKIDLVNI